MIQSGYSYTDQTLHFRLPLGGPFALWYRSARVPGFKASLSARVPLTTSEPPPDLRRVVVSTSLDGFRDREKYDVAPHLVHPVRAEEPGEVVIRVEYRFRGGAATSERRLVLGRPDPRALGLGGLLVEGVPVVDGPLVRFARGGSARIRKGADGVKMARARGALYVVKGGQVVGVHDAISGRRLWYGEGGRLVGPDGSTLNVERSGSGVALSWRGYTTTLEVDDWVRSIRSPTGSVALEFSEDGLLTRLQHGDREERVDYDEQGRLQDLWRGESRLAFVRSALPDGYRASVSDGRTVDRRAEVRFVDGAVHREERCCGHGPTRTVRTGEEVVVHRPDGTVVTLSRRGRERTLTTTLPSGTTRTVRATRTVAADQATHSLDAGDGEWTMRRDAASRTIEWRSPGGRLRRMEMDEEDRVVETLEYDGTLRRYDWDGNSVTVDGPLGRRRLEVGEQGALTQSSASGSRSVEPGSSGTRIVWGGETLEADGDAVRLNGRPYVEFVRTGQRVEVMHGPHLLGASTRDGANEAVVSDGTLSVESGLDGRPVRMSGLGVERTFDWKHGRLVRAATPTSEIRIDYDGSELQFVALAGEGQDAVAFERDSAGTLSAMSILGERYAVEVDDGVVVRLGPATWELDDRSIRTGVMRVGVLEQRHRYDEWGRRTELRVVHAGRELLGLRWTYDEAGRVSALDVGGEVRRYRYDGERLVGVEGAEDAEEMEYLDGRLVALNGTPVLVDDVGRPSAVGGGPVEMTPGGRVESIPLAGEQVRLGYNAAGELTSIEGPAGITQITRDALGRAEWIDGPEGRRGIVWGPDGPVARLDGDGRVVERLLSRPGRRVPDLIIEEGRTRAVVADHLGSPVALIDVDTGEVERSSWSAFGERRSGASLIGFAGSIELSRGPDVVDMGVRSYLPAVGRWAQWDPLLHRGGGTDLYGYAAGDPVNHVDPTGRTVEVCRDNEGLRHRWIKTDTYEAGQDRVQSGQWYEQGLNTEWVDHTGRRGTVYRDYTCEVVDGVDEDCVNSRIKPGTDIGVYLFEPMYRTYRIGDFGLDIPVLSICWNVVGDVLADCKIIVGEDPNDTCWSGLPLPEPEPDHTPNLGYTPNYETWQTLDRDHTPDLGYTPLDGGNP